MNKLAIAAAAALTVATFGAAAIAQGTGEFGNADANKDNMVSWDEAVGVYPTLTQELFNQADENADGSLDEGEFTSLVGLTAGLDGQAGTSSSAPAADPMATSSSSSMGNDGTSTPSSSAP